MATTFKKLAELIRDTYYNSKASDDSQHSLRFFGELIATCVAECANEDSIVNSNQQEASYANNQFISTFKSVPLLLDTDGTIYSILPSTPTALPNGSEIVSIRITGNKCMDCIPMKAQASFAQDLIGLPKGMVLFEVNGTKVVYTTSNALFDNDNTATIKMVGAVSGTDLMTSELTVPKNYEARIWDKIMARVLPLKRIPYDLINDAVSNPA